MAANIERKQGDTYPVVATIQDADGNAFDLTGATAITLGIDADSANTSPDDATYTSTGTIVSATDGTVSFPVASPLADAAVANYYAEIQFTQGGYVRSTKTFRYNLVGQIVTS